MIAPALIEQALSMDAADKAEFVGIVLDSLDAPDPHDHDLDSLSEAILRSKELNSGAVKALTQEEFWRNLRRG
jgi:hypothetical protein